MLRLLPHNLWPLNSLIKSLEDQYVASWTYYLGDWGQAYQETTAWNLILGKLIHAVSLFQGKLTGLKPCPTHVGSLAKMFRQLQPGPKEASYYSYTFFLSSFQSPIKEQDVLPQKTVWELFMLKCYNNGYSHFGRPRNSVWIYVLCKFGKLTFQYFPILFLETIVKMAMLSYRHEKNETLKVLPVSLRPSLCFALENWASKKLHIIFSIKISYN